MAASGFSCPKRITHRLDVRRVLDDGLGGGRDAFDGKLLREGRYESVIE